MKPEEPDYSPDRGEATQPAELTEAEWILADLQWNVDKGERLARRDDQHAMDLQIQMQGCIGGLPE